MEMNTYTPDDLAIIKRDMDDEMKPIYFGNFSGNVQVALRHFDPSDWVVVSPRADGTRYEILAMFAGPDSMVKAYEFEVKIFESGNFYGMFACPISHIGE